MAVDPTYQEFIISSSPSLLPPKEALRCSVLLLHGTVGHRCGVLAADGDNTIKSGPHSVLSPELLHLRAVGPRGRGTTRGGIREGAKMNVWASSKERLEVE